MIALHAMKADKNTGRGNKIYYDRIPDDIYDNIIDVQAAMQKEKKRTVSLPEAINRMIKHSTLYVPKPKK